VAARAPGRLDAAVVGAHEVEPDLVAVGLARLGGLDEPDARAHEQRLDRGDRDVERRRELGVGEPVDLAHQQRRALLLGQPADVDHEPPQVLAPLGLLERVVQRGARGLEDRRGGRDGPPQVVDAAVVGDAVQPRPHLHRPVVRAQRPVGAHEDVLQHVLGVLARRAREHLAHVGEQALAVAVVQRAERLGAAGAEQGEQLLVRAQPQESRPDGEPVQARRGVQG
jgi:hypothetical protein